MGTEVIKVTADGGYVGAVRVACEAMIRGGLVVFPTETVYGLGARADHPQAMARLRQLKSRTDGKPFTVHLASRADVDRLVPNLSGVARRLVNKGFPGPLTLVLPADVEAAPIMKELPKEAARELAYDGMMGLRCPDDAIASRLLAGVPHPVVASSANLAGHEPTRTGAEALAELDGRVDVLIDAGQTRYAKPSTIVRVVGDRYEIVREGVYDARMIAQFAKIRVLFICTGNTCRSPMAAAMARGMLAERFGCRPGDLEDRGVVVESAGTFGGGGGASPQAVEVMAKRGIDLSDHWSRPVTAEMVHQADYAFAMTKSHRETAAAMAPSAAERIKLLGGNEDITDPAGGSIEGYERSAEAIEKALRVRLQEVTL